MVIRQIWFSRNSRCRMTGLLILLLIEGHVIQNYAASLYPSVWNITKLQYYVVQ